MLPPIPEQDKCNILDCPKQGENNMNNEVIKVLIEAVIWFLGAVKWGMITISLGLVFTIIVGMICNLNNKAKKKIIRIMTQLNSEFYIDFKIKNI